MPEPLETERLQLRRFTAADADLLVELDSDPAVMRFINGGRPTPRSEIEDDVLPAWLGYVRALRPATASGRRSRRRAARSSAGSTCARTTTTGRASPSSATACGRGVGQGLRDRGQPGADRARLPRARRRARRRRDDGGQQWPHGASWRRRACATCATFHQEWPDKIEGDEHGDVEYALTRAEWSAAQVT